MRSKEIKQRRRRESFFSFLLMRSVGGGLEGFFEKNIQFMVPNVLRVPWPLTLIYTHDENNDDDKNSLIKCDNNNCNTHHHKQK